MSKKLPDTQRQVLLELGNGTELARVQKFAWAPVQYYLGDKTVSAGSVAGLAMAGLIRPADRIEIGSPKIRYELTESGRRALALLAAA